MTITSQLQTIPPHSIDYKHNMYTGIQNDIGCASDINRVDSWSDKKTFDSLFADIQNSSDKLALKESIEQSELYKNHIAPVIELSPVLAELYQTIYTEIVKEEDSRDVLEYLYLLSFNRFDPRLLVQGDFIIGTDTFEINPVLMPGRVAFTAAISQYFQKELDLYLKEKSTDSDQVSLVGNTLGVAIDSPNSEKPKNTLVGFWPFDLTAVGNLNKTNEEMGDFAIIKFADALDKASKSAVNIFRKKYREFINLTSFSLDITVYITGGDEFIAVVDAPVYSGALTDAEIGGEVNDNLKNSADPNKYIDELGEIFLEEIQKNMEDTRAVYTFDGDSPEQRDKIVTKIHYKPEPAINPESIQLEPTFNDNLKIGLFNSIRTQFVGVLFLHYNCVPSVKAITDHFEYFYNKYLQYRPDILGTEKQSDKFIDPRDFVRFCSDLLNPVVAKIPDDQIPVSEKNVLERIASLQQNPAIKEYIDRV